VNGLKEWFINGKKYTKDEFNKITNSKAKELVMKEVSFLLNYEVEIIKRKW
jgi:hypothetical protein